MKATPASETNAFSPSYGRGKVNQKRNPVLIWLKISACSRIATAESVLKEKERERERLKNPFLTWSQRRIRSVG